MTELGSTLVVKPINHARIAILVVSSKHEYPIGIADSQSENKKEALNSLQEDTVQEDITVSRSSVSHDPRNLEEVGRIQSVTASRQDDP